jgi:hypothetical protein
LKRLAALQAEVDKKKAEPRDTHGFLGTWKCVTISPNYKKGEKFATMSCSSTVEVERFDGEFYWADGRGTCTARDVNGTTQRRSSFRGKKKYWFVGDKLMGLLYSTSNKNDEALNKTLEYRVQNGKFTGIFSGTSGEATWRSTVVCTK